jgi:hypothetical protein
MVNFYRKFLRSAAQVLAPLTDALKGPGKTISWSPLMNSAFNRAKLLLSAVPELVHPQPNAAISLSVDASDTHIGAVLEQQLRDESWAPLAFFSKSRYLNPRLIAIRQKLSSRLSTVMFRGLTLYYIISIYLVNHVRCTYTHGIG